MSKPSNPVRAATPRDVARLNKKLYDGQMSVDEVQEAVLETTDSWYGLHGTLETGSRKVQVSADRIVKIVVAGHTEEDDIDVSEPKNGFVSGWLNDLSIVEVSEGMRNPNFDAGKSVIAAELHDIPHIYFASISMPDGTVHLNRTWFSTVSTG